MSQRPPLQRFSKLNHLLTPNNWQPKRGNKRVEKRLLIPLLSVLASFLASHRLAQADTNRTAPSPLPQVVFEQSFDPPASGEPPRTSGAGSRGGQRCASSDLPIQPLMPKRNFGLTFYDRPPVFLRMPRTSAQKVVLTFRDETGAYLKQAILPITQQGDVVSFSLPDDTVPLIVGKNYQWILAVMCGETGQPNDPVFSGWVQRVDQSAALRQELGRKTPLQQAQWYGAHGYWYDLLNVLIQARRSHPHDPTLTAVWQSFFASLQADAPTSN